MFAQQSDLCQGIVHQHYGPVVAAVAKVLIHDGRLPLGSIIKKTQESPLNVRQSLAVLIQHGIVTFAASKEAAQRMVTYYSVSTKNILRLQRSGLYLALVEERVGAEGLEIFRTILVNGMMTVGSVRENLGCQRMGQSAKAKLNGAVAKLVRDRYIAAVMSEDTTTKLDLLMREEAKEIEKLALPPTAKELKTIRDNILHKEEEAQVSPGVVGLTKRRRGSVLSGSEDDGHVSKVHVGENGHHTAVVGNNLNAEAGIDTSSRGNHHPVDLVDDGQYFRVYYDRLDVFLRNKQVANYFTDKYNDGVGAVVKSLLRLTEPHTRTCLAKKSNNISASQIFQGIPQEVPLIDSIDTADDMYYQKPDRSQQHSGDNLADSEYVAEELERKRRSEAAFALLEVIHSDSSGIVRKTDERGAGQFEVDFVKAAAILRDQCLDTMVHEKFGSNHARLIRVLREKEKLDEKVISQAAMLPLTICREKLHDLSRSDMLDTFEIPRTADRNPSRTLYLWFVNPDKQVRSAMRFVFQSMSNVIQRIEAERSRHQLLLSKTKREDVIADNSLLTDNELKRLDALNKTQEKLYIANIHLDSMLLLIHDINPSSSDLKLTQ